MEQARTKKRVRLNPEDREQQIITAAIGFAAERGLNFSTRELAQHCGVSQSLLYRYFSNKDGIVEKIYEHVYLGRWDPFWDEILIDGSQPVQQRLTTYLKGYCTVILKKDWVRIYLLSSFEDPSIARRYTALLRRRIFEPILDELLVEEGLSSPRDEAARDMALDLIWSFHSSFFYIGIRTWVYRLPHDISMEQTIAARTTMFLDGFRPFLHAHWTTRGG